VKHILKNRIKELRKANGISSPELAKRLGISRSYLWKIENEGGGSTKILVRIDVELGVTLNDIFFNQNVSKK
jgi:putative transcriptional regulator